MSFDKIYADLVLAIKEKGILQNPDEVRAHYEDGEPAPMTEEVLNAEPKLVLPWEEADMTNFFECPLSELKVKGYKHNGRFNYEVAI